MQPLTLRIGHVAPTSVETLIDSIQACNTDWLSREIRALTTEPSSASPMAKNPLDQQMPGTRLTALHVAARAYAHFRNDRNRAFVFNRAVALLLEAGANPFIEALGTARPQTLHGKTHWVLEGGLTVADVCQGHVPPALSEWFAQHVDDNLKQMHNAQEVHSTTLARESRRRTNDSMALN